MPATASRDRPPDKPHSTRRIAVVGATGAVGRELIRVLAQRGFPSSECALLASARSSGQRIEGVHGPATVEALTVEALEGVEIAFVSAGGSVSRDIAPLAAARGTVIIDNSSAFRLSADVPLIVPEINADRIHEHKGIIANPNCSTILMAMALWPLHRVTRVRRVVAATYQAASGAGARALEELESQSRDVLAGKRPMPHVFPVPCAFNVFSHNSSLNDDGANIEEAKMVAETWKIFGDESIGIAVTCMRVPVMRAHMEALAIEFDKPLTPPEAREILTNAPGIRVVDDRRENRFPTSLDADGGDDVLVGRIRRDPSVPDGRGLQLICTMDQLRKGAALNAVQIAELLIAET